MSPETVSTGDEGEGHSMLMDRKRKRRGNQQWRVWCEESGDWDYQKRSGEYGRVCKVEDSHRNKTEQCPWYSFSRECLSCTEFFVGLKPVEILKQRCDVGSFTCTCGLVFLVFVVVVFQYEASRTVLYATMALDRGSRRAREDNGSSQSVTEWVMWPVIAM